MKLHYSGSFCLNQPFETNGPSWNSQGPDTGFVLITFLEFSVELSGKCTSVKIGCFSRVLIHLLLSIFHFSENTWNNNTLRWDGSLITLVPYYPRRVERTTRSMNWKPTFQWHHNIMNTYHTAQFYLYLLHDKFKNAQWTFGHCL